MLRTTRLTARAWRPSHRSRRDGDDGPTSTTPLSGRHGPGPKFGFPNFFQIFQGLCQIFPWILQIKQIFQIFYISVIKGLGRNGRKNAFFPYPQVFLPRVADANPSLEPLRGADLNILPAQNDINSDFPQSFFATPRRNRLPRSLRGKGFRRVGQGITAIADRGLSAPARRGTPRIFGPRRSATASPWRLSPRARPIPPPSLAQSFGLQCISPVRRHIATTSPF
jgi:hypothetical protein